MSFQSELEELIRQHSIDGKLNTPDFILASFLNNCLIAFSDAVKDRDCQLSKQENLNASSNYRLP